MQDFSGLRQVALLRHRHKGPQLIDFHPCTALCSVLRTRRGGRVGFDIWGTILYKAFRSDKGNATKNCIMFAYVMHQ